MANLTASDFGFDALGDRTRRAVFERVAMGPAAVGAIAQALPVSRPAVSQHLKVLKDAGLVTETAEGTRRIYRIDPRGIGAMRTWIEAHWQAALADGGTRVDLEHRDLERYGDHAAHVSGRVGEGWPAQLAGFAEYARTSPEESL